MQLVQDNWLLFVIALVIGIAIAYWIFVVSRRTRVQTARSDALDEGAAPAARNQALIDAPPAAVPVMAPGLAGAGTAVAAVVEEQIAAAQAPTQTAAEPSGDVDDLSRIKGVGPKLKSLLISQGITRFSQIAAWSEEDIDRVDAQLGRFEGRIRRDSWVEQAALLAAGDAQAYQDKFGNL